MTWELEMVREEPYSTLPSSYSTTLGSFPVFFPSDPEQGALPAMGALLFLSLTGFPQSRDKSRRTSCSLRFGKPGAV
jgi:hypothetical protein